MSGPPTEEGLDIGDGCHVPADEIVTRADVSGGPGGQHANRNRTRITVSFDIASSRVLTEVQRNRLRSKIGDVATVTVDESRSQARNRAVAIERLRDKLERGLRRPKIRKKTKPSRSAKKRRLDAKRRLSEKKRSRRTNYDE